MRNYLLILVLIPSALGAQMKFSKALKKLGLASNEVLYTNEQILLYPRAMIYDLQETDSIAYLGCLSTDQMDFINYFEKGSKALKLPTGTNLQRRFEDDVDTILFEPFVK